MFVPPRTSDTELPTNHPTEENTLPIQTQAVEYIHDSQPLTGMFAWDDKSIEKRPGILVIHGGAGPDDHAKEQARRFAYLGYVALACDMYGNGVAGNRQRVMSRIAELRHDTAKLCARASAGIEVLGQHPQVDGRLAAVGYCFGGMVVLELARSGFDLMGAVSVHGTLDTSCKCQPNSVKARILVCHGALDPHVSMEHVNAFIAEMKLARTDWQLIMYGEAMHGFTHQGGPQIPGVAYHALSDARSAKAMQHFFSELFTRSAHLDTVFADDRED
jgi:dienelactone hydrolase